MYALVRFAGYLALLATPVALLAATLGRADALPTPLLTLESGVVLAGGVAAAAERERAFADVDATGFDSGDVVDGVAVVVGAVVAFALSVSLGLGPVLASALVGLVAGIAVPRVAVPAYCGSFVGMASPAVFPTFEFLLAAGALAAVAYVATTETFGGFGGKLGTIALFGCAAVLVLPGVEYAAESGLSWTSAGVVVPVAVAGAVATTVLSVRMDLGAVVGSALVGLVAGVAFPAVLSELGTTLAAVAFCASFVGMSTTERLDGEAHVALAGVVCGLVYVAVSPVFVGAGGKLGTIAFLSCLTAFGAAEITDAAAPRIRR